MLLLLASPKEKYPANYFMGLKYPRKEERPAEARGHPGRTAALDELRIKPAMVASSEIHADVRALVAAAYDMPYQQTTKAYEQADGTIVGYLGDVTDLVRNGGEAVKRLIQFATPSAVHLPLATTPCHQVAVTVCTGALAWAGATSSLIRVQSAVLREI